MLRAQVAVPPDSLELAAGTTEFPRVRRNARRLFRFSKTRSPITIYFAREQSLRSAGDVYIRRVDVGSGGIGDAFATGKITVTGNGATTAEAQINTAVAGVAERSPVPIPSANRTGNSAVQHVMAATFGAPPTPRGASPLLRETCINVQIVN